MARTNKSLSSLAKQLSSPKVSGLALTKSLSGVSLFAQTQSSSESTGKPSSTGDAKQLSFSAKDTATAIQFGRPSSTRTSSTSSSSALTNLLRQTASGGIASALGGGLGSIAGIGGLVSGIMSLFGGGGKSALPPLVEFQLPQTSSETMYVSSKGSIVYQGGSVEQGSATSPAAGIYTSQIPSANTSSSSSALQYQSSQIAQAVKTALLNSSSLNDVIAEI